MSKKRALLALRKWVQKYGSVIPELIGDGGESLLTVIRGELAAAAMNPEPVSVGHEVVNILPTSEIWAAYALVYEQTYHTPPIRNAMVNSQIKAFAHRVPVNEAAAIAGFFVSHPNAYYRQRMHPISLLLRDAEKLASEYRTGLLMTQHKAAEQDRLSHASDVWVQLMEKHNVSH